MNIRFASILLAATLVPAISSAAVSPPWETAVRSYLTMSFTAAPDAVWVTELHPGSFAVDPGTHAYPFVGPKYRFVMQEVGTQAELHVHVTQLPDTYMDGAPVLELFAGGVSVAQMGISRSNGNERVETSFGSLATTEAPMRWIGLTLAWPAVTAIGSRDGMNWDVIAETTIVADGPYHLAFGTASGPGAVDPIRFEDVSVGLEAIPAEPVAWSTLKALFN